MAHADERHETSAERADRLWDDLLQELRIVQTGAQLTAGFLLTLPFQQAFGRLSHAQHYAYLALVSLAAVVTALVLTPIALHRRLAGRHVKPRLVRTTAAVMKVLLAALAVLIVAITAFVFDVVVDTTAALAAGVALGVVLAGLLVGLPRMLVRG